MALETSSRQSAIAPGESSSPAALIATNAEPQAVTVTSPAARPPRTRAERLHEAVDSPGCRPGPKNRMALFNLGVLDTRDG